MKCKKEVINLPDNIQNAKKLVIEECQEAMETIDDAQTRILINAILEAEKVFFIGVGRVLLSLKCICKRLSHLGISTHYVGEITEPAITKKDLLIVGSGSGETLFPVAITKKAKNLGVKVAWIGSNTESTIAKLADYQVRIPVQSKLNKEDELKSEQPMTSLFEQSLLLYGDVIAKVIIDEQLLNKKDLWKYHANLE